MRRNYLDGLCRAFAGAGTNPYFDAPGPAYAYQHADSGPDHHTNVDSYADTRSHPSGADWTLADGVCG